MSEMSLLPKMPATCDVFPTKTSESSPKSHMVLYRGVLAKEFPEVKEVDLKTMESDWYDNVHVAYTMAVRFNQAAIADGNRVYIVVIQSTKPWDVYVTEEFYKFDEHVRLLFDDGWDVVGLGKNPTMYCLGEAAIASSALNSVSDYIMFEPRKDARE